MFKKKKRYGFVKKYIQFDSYKSHVYLDTKVFTILTVYTGGCRLVSGAV